MKRTMTIQLSALVAALAIFAGTVPSVQADVSARINVSPRPNADLQVWIWPDRGEGATYLEDDIIRLNVEATRSCFLVIYDIDTRGNLRVLFPNDPWDDNFVQGGEIVTFPREWDGYDWTVEGPSGTEYVQAIASEFPIRLPDWPVYMNSVNHGGAVCLDPELRDFRSGGDRLDYIRTVNRKITGRFWDWCATDLASFEVRPRYHYRTWYEPDPWPDVFYGEIFIGWPIGGAIYIDNVYIGIAPLWIPRRYHGGQHVLVCRQGHREVRRQNIRFYPKRVFTYDNDRYNHRVVIDNGHAKPGRRGGQEQFRTEIKQELRERDRHLKAVDRRGRDRNKRWTDYDGLDKRGSRSNNDDSWDDLSDIDGVRGNKQAPTKAEVSHTPRTKPGTAKAIPEKRRVEAQSKTHASTQKSKSDKGFKRSTGAVTSSNRKVTTKTKAVKKVTVTSKRSAGGSNKTAAKVSKSKSANETKTKTRSKAGKRSR